MPPAKDSLTLAQLLMTKYCHDLAGPLGGIQNGIEFLSEDVNDPDTVRQATALLGLSSGEAASRLQGFRQAYGTFNPDSGADMADFRRHVQDYFSNTKIVLEWDIQAPAISQLSRSALWQMLLLASQYLIYGGTIRVGTSAETDNLRLSLTGNATKMHKDAEINAVLERKSMPPEAISPKLAHALYWVQFCDTHGIATALDVTETRFAMQADFATRNRA